MFRNLNRAVSLLMVLTLVVLLAGTLVTGPVAAQDVPTCVPEAVGNRPDAPYWARHGSHWVGFTEFTIETGDRPIPVAMWYPALNPDCVEESITYEYDRETMAGIATWSSVFPREGEAIRDAVPDGAEGPYPVVIFGPSLWSHKLTGLVLGEHLASQGYVFMSADFEDNSRSLSDMAFVRSLVSRPRDISRIIDHALEMTTDGSFAGVIDAESVAVVGHQWGDIAAAQVGGARVNLGYYREFVESKGLLSNTFASTLLSHADDIAAVLGLPEAPDGLWPSLADPRVDAVVLLSALYWHHGENGLRTLAVPTLILDPSRVFTDVQADAAFPYNAISATDKVLVVFEGAYTWVFNPECEVARGDAVTDYMLCSDSTWDMRRAHDLTNHFVTAFLNYELLGNKRLCGALQPASVNVQSVRFESTIRCSR